MVAEVSYDSTSGTRDSLRFYYSTPARGAAHNPKNPASYRPLYFRPGAPFGGGALGTAIDVVSSSGLGSFYGNTRTQYTQFDSARYYVLSPSGTVTDSQTQVRNQYNVANRLVQTERYINSPTVPWERYTLTYNNAGNSVSAACYGQHPANTLALFYTVKSVYNPQNRAVMDSNFSSGVLNTPSVSRYLYTYNASGQLIQSFLESWTGNSWYPSMRASYFYNADGLLRLATKESYISNAWEPSKKDSFVYAGNNPAFIAEYGYTWVSTGWSGYWQTNYRTLGHLNAAGNWDTLTNQYYNSQTSAWQDWHRISITYNSYNNWESYIRAQDTTGDGILDASIITRCYYELWDNTLAVSPDARGIVPSVTLSPNPTNGTLHLTWPSTTAPTHYTLTDIQGRALSAGWVHSGASQMMLDMSAYAPGMYLLTLSSADGTILHREKVVRQ